MYLIFLYAQSTQSAKWRKFAQAGQTVLDPLYATTIFRKQH
jgi:hypothetical protein